MLLHKKREEEIICLLDERGCIFSGYEIAKNNNQPILLGTGGFSCVYEMNCFERPESKYVLKVMGFEKHVMTSENFWNTVGLQRFLGEQTPYVCRLLSAKEMRIALDEEGNIQEVSEVEGERWNEDGIHLQFILMERLEDIIGKNRFGTVSLLREELANEDEIIDLAIQVGQALYHAHNRDILHRDVKLENIFWDSESGCYKLGDFGIAKYVAGGNAETVVYTDGYGAPEIERHLYDCYNATADIYSFGITLYLLLNDFRFPGSEGYYVNSVQYSPEFIFSAPAHASEGMTRIIRKMCRFYQEERYQSMTEVLMDLAALKKRSGRKDSSKDEEWEFPDFETETYREEKEPSDGTSYESVSMELAGRAKRKADEQRNNKMYSKRSAWHFVGITLMLTLIMRSMQSDVSVISTWQFWVFPLMVLIESVLLRVRECHILFGGITLAVGVYLGIFAGVSAPYVILIASLITGMSVVTSSCVLATVLWTTLIVTGKMQWLDFIANYDLCWMLIVIVFFMLFHYLLVQIDYNKITYLRAKIGIHIFDKIYLAMVGAGLVLLVLEHFGVLQIPVFVQRFHLVRTGVVSFAIMVIYMVMSERIGLDEEEEQEYENEMDESGAGKRSDTIE